MSRRRDALVTSWIVTFESKSALHCIDKMGISWKARIEKLHEELNMEVVFFSPEDEAKFDQEFKDTKLALQETRKQLRRQVYGWSDKQKQIQEQQREDVDPENWEMCPHDIPGNLVANY